MSTNKKDSYMGNPLLKPVNTQQEWSKEQVAEYIKCKNDPIYFIKQYMKIVHVDEGLVPFNMYDYQEDIVKNIHENRFTCTMTCRQAGKSSCVAGFILYYIIFNQNKTVGILANKKDTATEILSRVQLAYQHLPKFIQQGCVEFNKGSFVLENGSKVLAAATSSDTIRGYSFSMLFIDECAFIPTTVWEDFYTSTYPTISSGKHTKIVLVSTPNGFNHFHKIWVDAEEKRNEFVPYKVDWRRVPGRDDAWKQETIRNTSEQAFSQEHELSFIGSSNTLISTWKLKELAYREPSYEKEGLRIYHKPRPDGIYVAICDVSEGVGGDYSTMSVIDIASENGYKIAATYRNNAISTLLFPDIIYKLATEYNDAYVLIETNSIGKQVADVLHGEFEFENILMTTSGGRKGQTVSSGFGASGGKLGVKTTNPVRRIGCSTLKTLIEENKLIIEQHELIEELSSFVWFRGKYQAEIGHTDDLSMTLVLFAWLTQQPYFRELLDINIRESLYEDKIKAIEDDLVPFGFIDDGLDDDIDEAGWKKVDYHDL